MAGRFVLVDADMLAGWRRPTPSFAQLMEAVGDLRAQEPAARLAIVADPSLKWALAPGEQEEIEEHVRTGRLVYAPAGCADGYRGFLSEVVAKAGARGLDPVVLTDQAITGARVGRVRREGERWVFDLEGVEVTAEARPAAGPRRRRPKSAA